jgi:hypothetical protein
MALSEQEQQRIREEEEFRLQVREELRRQHPDNRWATVFVWIALAAVAGLVLQAVYSGHR